MSKFAFLATFCAAFLLFLCAPIPAFSAGPALVQQSSGSNLGNNQNTLTVTLGNQPSSGNVLILFFDQVGASQTITSISGATWTQVAKNFTGNIGDSEIWVGTNPTSSTITITGTNYFGGFQPGYAIVSEFSGISSTVDGSAVNTTGGSWPVTTGSLTTASAGDLLLTSALSYNGGGAQSTVPSPWTLLSAPSGTYSLAAGYQVGTSAGTYAATWNGVGSPQVATIIVALKSSGGISATAGTPQSATVNSVFAVPLQVTLKDSNGNPVSGATVTFTAPSSGASATFSGSTTATALTNSSGIATAPALTANAQEGAYTINAAVAGLGTSAHFFLSNLGGPPASITATAGTPQSATVNTVFATALQATVKDAENNPVSGVTVAFTAPTSGAGASFGGLPVGVGSTNSSGVATAPALTANWQSGSYSVTASAVGVGTSASFSLTNITAAPASITATAGTPQSTTVSTVFATALQATVKDANNNPLSGVTVTFTAPSTGAGASFSGSATATAVTNNSGVASAPALTANGQAGSYTVTAGTAGVGTSASFTLTNTAAVTGGGSPALTGSGTSSNSTFSLTTEGSSDWVHWGDGSLTRKSGVTPQISNYSVVGSGAVMTYSNDPRALSWTDGTPTASGSNNNGIYINSQQNGFSFTAPADTGTRVLTVHVGGWMSGGTFTAHLSDNSAADYVDVTTPASGQFDRNYTLTYSAASAGQTLTVSWVDTSGGGNVTLNGAALSGGTPVTGSPTITATGGTPQSATVSTAFTTALQATVMNANNIPMSGVTVTFTAPPTGASATFSGSATATAVTNSSGIATAPALTANGLTGSYTITATAAGVSTSASFSLTNTAAVVSGGGGLAGSGTSSNATFSLTSEGSTDWVHWGDGSLTRKAGVSAQISNYAIVGSGPVMTYSNDPRPLSWSDGTPTTSGNNSNGIYINNQQDGFSFTAPADTTTRTLTVHVGGWLSGGTLTAHLSDKSAADYVDVTTPATGQYDRNYTLTYSAASAGQTLTVSWVNTSGGGNVTLNGAALSEGTGGGTPVTGSPTITATAGTPQSTTTDRTFSTPLQVTVTDGNGNPISYVTVTFTAPSTGASALINGSTIGTAITNTNGIATAPVLSANGQPGSYTITATASGVSGSASFNLTNMAAPPASIGVIEFTDGQITPVNTAFAIPLQAVVTDAYLNPLSGVTVTFTASSNSSTGASATFGGSATATAVTNANGIAIAPALMANGQAGSYSVTATVTGMGISASFGLTNTAASGGGGSGVTLVQQASGANLGNNQNTFTVTLSKQPASGDVLVLFFDQVSASQTISISGATWTQVAKNSGGLGDSEVWVGTNPTSTTFTITGSNNFGGFQPGYAIVSEFSGVSTMPDGPAVNTSGGSWPVTTGNLTTYNAGDLLLTSALSYNGGGAQATVASPWTPFNAPSGTYSLAAGYQLATTAGTYSATWNGAGSPQVATIVLALKGSGGATATAGTPQSTPINTAFATPLQATVKDANNNLLSGVTVTFTALSTGASATFSGSTTATAVTNSNGIATAPTLTANGQTGSYLVTATAAGFGVSASFVLTNLAGPPSAISATAGTPQSATLNTIFATPLQATVTDAHNNPASGVTVTFTAPGSGAGASFSGSATATAVTNSSGIATAPALTANGQAGYYTVTATASGVGSSASFNLTNITAPPVPITRVQEAQIDSMINIPSEFVSFTSPNTAGNWIGVAIFGGQGSTHTFTVTDSNGNVYKQALTQGSPGDNITLGMYYAENIKGGANTVTVTPDTSGYIRIVVVEYSGVATSNSLDVIASSQGNSVSPNSGTVNTTANGDLLWGAAASADAEPFAGPGYTLDALVPASPGTALTTEDQVQTVAGPASASLTLGSAKYWTMGLAAIKRAP